MVIKATQASLGMKAYNDEKGIIVHQNKIDNDILAGTRLLTFLICSWLEARLFKILYEDSSVGFIEQEIKDISSKKTMNDKWETAFIMSVCKSFNFNYSPAINITQQTYSTVLQKTNVIETLKLFKYIEEAIEVRNKLAHGQWHTHFNRNRSNTLPHKFHLKFDNIQKLDCLFQAYKLIADIISSYVTYKDKLNSKFDDNILKKIEKINHSYTRIEKSNFAKYLLPLKKKAAKHRNGYRQKNQPEL